LLAYSLRRVLATIPVMAVVGLLVFSLLYLAPGDPAAVIAGDQASPADIEHIRIALGLDRPFLIRFGGTVRGLKPGAPVEVRGIRIGEVTSVGVDYAPDSNGFVAPVAIVLQPSLFPAAGVHPRTAAEVYDAADVLVQRGLRAQVSDTQLLGGDAIVTLDIQPDAAPATLDRSGKVPELPAGPTQRERIAQQLQPLIAKLANAPIDQVFAELQDSMAALKQLVTGPELRGALEELRGASTDLRNVVNRLGTSSDALIINLNEPPSLLRNDLRGTTNNWIKVKLEGAKSNRSGIGARVLVHYGNKTQAQAVLSQSSFFSCNDPRLHFGLGPCTTADIDVYWPSGLHEAFKGISANRLVTLKEGVGPVASRGWSKA